MRSEKPPIPVIPKQGYFYDKGNSRVDSNGENIFDKTFLKKFRQNAAILNRSRTALHEKAQINKQYNKNDNEKKGREQGSNASKQILERRAENFTYLNNPVLNKNNENNLLRKVFK